MERILRILVRGSGDVGSAVAHSLFRAGYAVVIHDIPLPATTRRQMAFTDAIFDGHAFLEGVEARRIAEYSQVRTVLLRPAFIPVVVSDFLRVVAKVRPQVLVDARMRKHVQPGSQIQVAPLTIGLGPNFIAGVTVHLAIETAWGDSLGQVIERGKASPLAGEPKAIDGHARDRYVYAPAAGKFVTTCQVGDIVQAGQVVAYIGQTPLYAPIPGVLRGITHTRVPVKANAKVIEIDPRLENPQISGIAERPARIAQGVLQAIQAWEKNTMSID